ncbi:hypothetical protein PROFUN_05120 [Planoprotostelium fungivorum]|uniref:Uncharacterized protein n=1 Tax=Planoprotostelium fungivorum TaxID=1890364 RepID=A0A2P6NRS0_9EUKA|nr:hypothetical protein PROFUN_05120 [Planoprotostelium fungivorum]
MNFDDAAQLSSLRLIFNFLFDEVQIYRDINWNNIPLSQHSERFKHIKLSRWRCLRLTCKSWSKMADDVIDLIRLGACLPPHLRQPSHVRFLCSNMQDEKWNIHHVQMLELPRRLVDDGLTESLYACLEDERMQVDHSLLVHAVQSKQPECLKALLTRASPLSRHTDIISVAIRGGRRTSDCLDVLIQDGRAPLTSKHLIDLSKMGHRTDLIGRLLRDPKIDPSYDNNAALRSAANTKIAEEILQSMMKRMG